MPSPYSNSESARRQAAFQSLVNEHYPAIWKYVLTLTRGASEAEDLTHQAFLIAFDRMTDGHRISNVGPWLRGVVRNLVREWWRNRQRMPIDLADQVCQLAEEADHASDELRAEREAALGTCLDKLKESERSLVRARYEEGQQITAIADQQQINVKTARVRLFRIRERLKSCVELAFEGGAAE